MLARGNMGEYIDKGYDEGGNPKCLEHFHKNIYIWP